MKLICSKPSLRCYFFCHLWQAYSYSFYILNTQTIAKWKKRVVWEICTLTGQTVVVWCGSRSGEWSSGNHRSWNVYLSQKWGTTSGKMKIINVPETVLQYWKTVSGTFIIFSYHLWYLIFETDKYSETHDFQRTIHHSYYHTKPLLFAQ